jgi:hypothetical protein
MNWTCGLDGKEKTQNFYTKISWQESILDDHDSYDRKY